MSRSLLSSLCRWISTWVLPACVCLGHSSAAEPPKQNRLARESSPYLLQHASNPVDWYPWGPEAFERAKKENKLIFLSIGYSSCHWCHVMERESFTNAELAKVFNEHFVCIKVDREERPDIDEIYLTALQATRQRGGWPMTLFLTPAGKPIFGGTYFPLEDKKSGEDTIPGMKSILAAVIKLDKDDHAGLLKQADLVAEKTLEALNRNFLNMTILKLERSLVTETASAYDFDPQYGGTGSKSRQFQGPKFPQPPVWSFLLSQSRKPGQEALARSVKLTLHQIAAGGIYDQLGGGFHRYSTERTWQVPHFEKMLYDNAQLLELYSEAYTLDPDPDYRRVVRETLSFLRRDMTGPEGGFYSALDADSNHREGEYYVWTIEEIKAILANEADTALVLDIYTSGTANFEGKYHILHLAKPLAEAARDRKLSEEELLKQLAPLREKLLAARQKRVTPFLDTKIITAWNGLAIAGCARAGAVFNDPQAIQMARRAADFALSRLKGADGRLFRHWSAVPGEKPAARGTAFLDDYADLIHGLHTLHDATGEKRWLEEAQALTAVATQWYGDSSRSGFYFTPSDGEKLFARSRDSYDGVQPSGNSQMARNLLKLFVKTKDTAYRDQCIRTIKSAGLSFRTAPGSVPTLAQALDELLDLTQTETTNPKASTSEAKKPRESADVVAARVEVDEKTVQGERPFTLTLTIAPDWHIYASPVGDDKLVESQTEVSLVLDKTGARCTAIYPKGKTFTDSTGDRYNIYEGTVTITGTIPANGGDPEFHVKVIACRDGACLLKSVLKVRPAK